jgi:aryl-alcohol dehydrogenase-like predicted oxidoreductase
MRYKMLGRSGLRVSEIALGTMTFGTEWAWGSDLEEGSRDLCRHWCANRLQTQ